MNNTNFLLYTTLAISCCFSQSVIAQTKVTSFAPSGTIDPLVWFESDVRTGGATSIVDLTGQGGNLENNQPLPVGAAKLTTDFTNAAKAEVGVWDNYGTPSNTFASLNLSYSFLKAANAGQNTSAAPSLKLTYWYDGCPTSSDCYGSFIYEPYWNGLNPPAQDVWTDITIDADNGLFWTTGMFGFANSAGGPPLKTLNEWLAAMEPDFGDATLIQVAISVGSYNQGQIGYFDDVAISHSTYNQWYDFEPPTPISCEGFQAPMDKTVNVKKKNRVLPLKMVCFDSDGNELTDADLSAAPVVEIDFTGGEPTVPAGDDFLPAGQGDEGNQFSYSGNAWQFNLQTKNFSGSGTYTITAVSGDGTEYVINPFPVAEFVIQ